LSVSSTFCFGWNKFFCNHPFFSHAEGRNCLSFPSIII
jgi:hypothetical protein